MSWEDIKAKLKFYGPEYEDLGNETGLDGEPPAAPGVYVHTPSASIASHRAFVTFASAPHIAARRAELCN